MHSSDLVKFLIHVGNIVSFFLFFLFFLCFTLLLYLQLYDKKIFIKE